MQSTNAPDINSKIEQCLAILATYLQIKNQKQWGNNVDAKSSALSSDVIQLQKQLAEMEKEIYSLGEIAKANYNFKKSELLHPQNLLKKFGDAIKDPLKQDKDELLDAANNPSSITILHAK